MLSRRSIPFALVLAQACLGVFSQSSLAAESCSAIDLRGGFLGPVRDQGKTGWCFNYAAADLLDFHIGKRISVTDLGIQNHEKSFSGRTTLDRFAKPDQKIGYGGKIAASLKHVRRGHVCLEEDLSSERFEKISETVSRGKPVRTSAQLDIEATNLEILKIKKTLDSNGKPQSWIAFPGTDRASFYEIVQNHRADEIWENLIQVSCGDRREATGHYKINTRMNIDQALEQGKIAGIEYDASFLKTRNSQLYAPHASTIVGRRTNPRTGKCEFLLRNTWGEDCKGYRRDIDCELGHLWVDREELDDALSGTVVLEAAEI